MGKFDFTGLMEDEKPSIQHKYDFTGLMDEEDKVIPRKKSYSERVLSTDVEDKIKGRGSVWSEFKPDTSFLGRTMTGLKTVGLPFELLQSGISNPIIEMQKGNINPVNAAKASFEGFVGKRQGEYGDVARGVGIPEPISAGIGLAVDVAVPIGLAKMAAKLGQVTKFADAKTAKAIKSFTKAVSSNKGALQKVGGKVGAYYDDIGKVAVDKSKFLDEVTNATNTAKKSISDIPSAKLSEVEDVLLDLVDKGDVNAVRHAQDMVDDLITQWNKAAVGGKVSKAQKYLLDLRKNLGGLIDDSVKSFKIKQIGVNKAEKYLKNFKKVKTDYSTLKKGYSDVLSRMVNPKTGKATKTGRLLNEILDPREGDLRKTLASINKFGTKSNKFAQELKAIESSIRFREFISKIGAGVGYGGAVGVGIGATLGKAREVIEKEQKGKTP